MEGINRQIIQYNRGQRMGGAWALAKRVGYIEFIWAEGRMRLYVHSFLRLLYECLLPQAHYHVPDGWLK